MPVTDEGLKAGDKPAIQQHRLAKHRRRADPEPPVAVFLPVDHELLERLAVPGDADDGVFVSLVVPVAARRDLGPVVPRPQK